MSVYSERPKDSMKGTRISACQSNFPEHPINPRLFEPMSRKLVLEKYATHNNLTIKLEK